jgi:hypothetical protein
MFQPLKLDDNNKNKDTGLNCKSKYDYRFHENWSYTLVCMQILNWRLKCKQVPISSEHTQKGAKFLQWIHASETVLEAQKGCN